MTVANGQDANQTTFNNAFVSKTADDTKTGKINLENSDTTNLTDVQRVVNEIADQSGINNQASTDGNAKQYDNNNVLADGENQKESLERIDREFNSSTGHNHDGSTGSGGQINASTLSNINLFKAEFQEKVTTTDGNSSLDVTVDFSSETAGGNANTKGVVTSVPYNFCSIIDSDGGEIEDTQGRRVFGRITESSGTWTLSFYVNISGVENAATISTQDIRYLYRKVFDQNDRPTFGADVLQYDSQNVVADVPDATVSQSGKVNTGVQEFGGSKNFASRPTIMGSDAVDTDSVQNISNKNYVGGTTHQQISTPPVPASNFNKLYFKADGNLYKLDESNNEIEIGSGGSGGSGRKNYAEGDSSTFESGIGAWYKSDNLAFSVSSQNTTLLRGLNSGRFYAFAGRILGDFVGLPITIDNTDQASLLEISFDYTTDNDYVDGDWDVILYDVTNAKIINSKNNAISAGEKTKFCKYYQTSPDSTSYEVRFLPTFSTAVAGRAINLDNFVVTPDVQVCSSNADVVFKAFRSTNQAITSTSTTVVELDSVTIDTVGGFNSGVYGFEAKENGYYHVDGFVAMATMSVSTNTFQSKILVDSGAGNQTKLRGSRFALNTPATRSNVSGVLYLEKGDIVKLGMVQDESTSETLQGGEINTQMSVYKIGGDGNSSNGGQLLAKVSAEGSTQSVANATLATLINPTVTKDNLGIYDSSTGYFRFSKNTRAKFKARAVFANTAWNVDKFAAIDVYNVTDATVEKFIARQNSWSSITTFMALNGSVTVDVEANKDYAFRIQHDNGAAINLLGSSNTYFEVNELPDTSNGSTPSQVNYYGNFTTDSGQSLNSNADIVYENKIKDTHNAYNTTTGVFEAPFSDTFRFSGTLQWIITGQAANQFLAIRERFNGGSANDYVRLIKVMNGTITQYDMIFEYDVYLEKGQTFNMITQENTGTATGSTDDRVSRLFIKNLNRG